MKNLINLTLCGVFSLSCARLVSTPGARVPSGLSSEGLCQEPVVQICRVRNPQTHLKAIVQQLRQRFPVLQGRGASLGQRRVASLPAIAAAEAEVYRRSPASMAEVNALFEEVRSTMRSLVTSNPHIPEAQKPLMLQALADVRVYFRGSEFISAEAQRRMRNNPERGIADNTDRAFRDYSARCEDNGLGVNAVNNGAIAICSGLVASLLDRVHSKDDLLTALAFTFGHELSHSIGPEHFAEVYGQLGSCYNSISGNAQFWSGDTSRANGGKGRGRPKSASNGGKPQGSSPENSDDDGSPKAEETTADWWGAQVLARVIQQRNLSGEAVFTTIGNATDDLCESEAGGGYPSGQDRIGLTILRNPLISQRTGCYDEMTATEHQYCQLDGAASP